MIDLKRTFKLIKGALLDPAETWRSYLPDADDWVRTAVLLTGPLIILANVLAYVIGILGSDASVFGFRPTLLSTLVGIVTGAIAAGAVAFIVSALAGMFGGRSSFARGLAATSLAFVPGYVGQALGWLPWIGSLIALVLFVYALVLLWRIIPLYLDVPEGKRAAHYIVSLIATIVFMFLVSMLIRPFAGPGSSSWDDFSQMRSSGDSTSGLGGIVGSAMRQAELAALAAEDRYQPPRDGELDEEQVEEFIRVMTRTREMMEEKAERLRELAERADKDQQMSISDMGAIMGGTTEVMGMSTLELEVVKSGGGNWAEHQWIKDALRTAYIQKDINDTVEHNYRLYMKYEDELKPFIGP